MHLKTVCKRLVALVLAVFMMLTLLPVSVFAEEIDSDMTSLADTDIVTPDTPIADAGINDFTPDTSENTEESDDTSAVQEPETETKEEGTDEGMSDGVSVEDEQTEDEDAAASAPEKPSDDTTAGEVNEDDSEQQDSDTEELATPVLRSAASPSRFTGNEVVRLGKEGNNINGIITHKDGGNSTSIIRHWVSVDGDKYTAFCIEASDSSTSGRDGGLEPGTDAGLLWILNNIPDGSDEDYAIKQQAVWAYLGQSLAIKNVAAGSRCSLSTDQLRERLTDIVNNAQNASLTGSQELWIAYHLDNRSYYQDMAFTVAEPPPSITPTPVPTPTPTPTPTPITGSIRAMKSDASTGSALVGAVFQLLDAAFAPVGSPITTDASGDRKSVV